MIGKKLGISQQNFYRIAFSSVIVVLSKLLSLFVVPFTGKYLSLKDFGVLSEVLLITSILALLLNLGLNSSCVQLFHAEENHEDGSRYFITAEIFYHWIGYFIGFILFVLLLFKYSLSIVISVVVLVFYRPFDKLFLAKSTVYGIHYKYVYFKEISVVVSLVLTFLIIFTTPYKIEGRLVGLALPLIVIFFAFRSRTGINPRKLKGNFIQLLQLGLKFIPAIFAYELLNYFDQIMISSFLGTKSLGIYAYNYRLFTIPFVSITVLTQIWKSKFYVHFKNGDMRLIRRFNLYWFIGALLISSLSLLFFYTFSTLFSLDKFGMSIIARCFMSFGIGLGAIIFTLTMPLIKKNKSGRVTFAFLVGALINVGLNAFLINTYGLTGAAFATFVSYFLVYFYLLYEGQNSEI